MTTTMMISDTGREPTSRSAGRRPARRSTHRRWVLRSPRGLGDDGDLLRERVRVALGVERLLDPGPQLTGDAPLLERLRLDHEADEDPVGSDLLDAPDLGLLEHDPAESRSCATSSATRLITAVAAATSVSGVIATSSTARAHCCDLLPTRRISPFGMCHTVPSTSRRRVVRRLTPSTVPVASPASITSPTPYWSSTSMKMPGEEVAHERLGAEPDRDAEDAGAGDERREVRPRARRGP